MKTWFEEHLEWILMFNVQSCQYFVRKYVRKK